MSEIARIAPVGDATRSVQTVAGDGRRRRDGREDEPAPEESSAPRGSEELAVALAEEGHGAMKARLEQNEDGATVIRVVDADSGETVAVVTPEELRELSEQTGLPAGMLLEARS